MMRLALFLICALFAAPRVWAASATYYIPPPQFNAVMQIMDMGFANDDALFRNATGSFTFDDATKTFGNLRFALDATSLVANNAATQRELATMLGNYQYPEIRITMPDNVTFADGKAELKTTVTLHGNSKPVIFSAVLNKSGKSSKAGGMWSNEGDAAGLSLRGELKRGDFGLGDSADMPGRFGDTIILMIDVQAIQQ